MVEGRTSALRVWTPVRRPEHDGRLASVASWQCVVDHGKDMPGVLLLAGCLPHRGVGTPVVQYLHVDEHDWEEGHHIIDARDSIPVHGDVIVHNGWKSFQKHRRQELRELALFAEVGGYTPVGFA